MSDIESYETPRDKFLRLAPTRTASALKRINAIGHLTSSSYAWESAEAQKILDDLYTAVNALKQRFEKKVRGRETQFTYDPYKNF